MILVFGGTTEGKEVAELLDFLSEPYFYSTKTNVSVEIKGTKISGAMDQEQIVTFCKHNQIRLMIDAAHPFAVQLHQNIFHASKNTEIPVIRFERNYPIVSESPMIKRFPSFPEMVEALQISPFKNILVLTGVQTIPWFRPFRDSHTCYFRVLATEQSIRLAKSFGVDDKYLIAAHPENDLEQLNSLVLQTGADVILTKESGESGFFSSKVKASEQSNIPLWVLARPPLPKFNYQVNSQKELLQLFYQLKKTTLKTSSELRTGFTTGTCVTAAAKASFIALVEGKFPPVVEVQLPDGSMTSFKIFPEELKKDCASCVVIKNAGDDPDVTHGKEIGCKLRMTSQPGILFIRGKGVGEVTMPGLQLQVGEPAINPVPRKMIRQMLDTLSATYEIESGFKVEPFVPKGEELAKQTFNPRVGVIGGISIIGTSGKVIPYSNEAFLSTIRYQLSVARESGLDEIVLTAGKRSENILKPYYGHLPDTAFIHYGNLIGASIQASVNAGIGKITLGLMLGKAVKLAEGHLDTHSKHVTFNPEFAVQIARQCRYSKAILCKIKEQNLANAIPAIIPFSSAEPFYKAIVQLCFQVCRAEMHSDVSFKLYLISDHGEMIAIDNQKGNSILLDDLSSEPSAIEAT